MMFSPLPPLVMERSTLDNVPNVCLPTGYILRCYHEGDAPGLVRLYQSAGVGPETEELFARNVLGDGVFSPERILMVVRQGRTVAAASAWVCPEFSGRACLLNMAVAPEYRGMRLGASLATATLRHARHEGFALQCLQTEDWRESALRLYIGLGYRPVHTHASHPGRWLRVVEHVGSPQVLMRARVECFC